MNDLISRRKAFEYFVTLWECIGTIMDRDEWEDVCMTTANEIPSVQPERKTGKWEGYNADNPKWQRTDGTPIFLVCPECNGSVLNNGSAHWNFCPNCGADMRGEQNATN